MRTAVLSWRYLGHPQAGGAEILAHEILRRCVARGWEVTAFTGTYADAPARDELDGVQIIRRGVQHTVHAHAWRWLHTRLESFDRVVEIINTLPFLTPLYVPAHKRRLMIHQLAREYWFRETRGLFRLGAPIGYALEPWYLRLYRRTPTITISDSSRADLEALGIPVTTVLPLGLKTPPVEALDGSGDQLRLVVLGRLTPAKFVEDALEAFAILQSEVPDASLDVIGDGDPHYRLKLERLVAERGLRDVIFHGHVEEARKRELLAAARFHVFASRREGWGLTVSEAASVGTPTVGYDSPGVRDSVADARLLATDPTPRGLAERMLALHRDPQGYEDARAAAWERTRQLDWGRTAEVFMEAVE